ncbi:hypothetical protein SALBM311S_03815 [Streptomyces alboniger]
MPKRLCGCIEGRMRSRMRAGRDVPRQRGGDHRVEFVEGIDGDQGAVRHGQAQQRRVLGGAGDHQVLAAYAVPECFAQLGGGGDVHARALCGGLLDEGGCLVRLLRVVDEPVHVGRVQSLLHGAEVGGEGIGEQEMEGAVEGVGEFGQQSGCHHRVGGGIRQHRQGRPVRVGAHCHRSTSVPRPASRASWAKRWPRAMSVTTRPLL